MNLWKATTFLFAGLFVATVAVSAVPSADAAIQPHMKGAMAALKKAQIQLTKASPDKGGHRVKALDLVQQAIDETQAGIDFDNTH